MTMPEIMALTIAVFLGAMVSGFSGFAFSAVCGAVLFHFYEPHGAIPLMMACSIISQLLTMVLLRRSLQFRSSTGLLVGGVAGVSFAIMVVGLVNANMLRWFFGAFLAVYASYLLFRAPLEPLSASGTISETLVGTLGGAIGVLTAMPGAIPTVWCEIRGFTKEQQRGFVQPFIIAMQIVALILFAFTPVGIPRELPGQLLIALPALFFGSWLGAVAFQNIDSAVVRKAVLLLLIFSGCTLLR